MSNTLEGRVISLLAGFYFVQLGDRILRCRARGRLKSLQESPVVGDMVEVQPINHEEGVLTAILPRHNLLQRPTVANVTQMVIMAAFASPPPNILLIDRLLVTAGSLGLKAVLCFNKADLTDDRSLRDLYEKTGYTVVEISLKKSPDLNSLFRELTGQVSVLAGQSGVGKSSLLKSIKPELDINVGKVSEKTQHGRHTTRHVELIYVDDWKAYVVDTPGFSKLDLPLGLKSRDLSDYYPELSDLRGDCRFGYDCRHQSEPDCAVLNAVSDGKISRTRHENYSILYAELVERERSQYR